MTLRIRQTSCQRAVSIMLDSGAFSAWRSNVKIDLDEYAAFLQARSSELFCYVNLDVLPGKYRCGTPSASEVEETAKLSWKNYLRLKKKGLNAMPVFHRGERFYWLEKMVKEGVDYIGLGGVAMGTGQKQRRDWLNRVFDFLCGDRGWPPVKLHGFGIAALDLMFNYPWYSVDSTVWRTPAVFGKVLVPRMKTMPSRYYTSEDVGSEFEVDYSEALQVIVNTYPGRKKQLVSFNNLGKRMKTYIRNYFSSLGVDFEAERESGEGRRKMLIRYFQKAVEQHIPKPFSRRNKAGFFNPSLSTAQVLQPSALRFFYGIGPLKEDWELFLKEGVQDRLTAYPALKKVDTSKMARFIRTGVFEE